MNSSHENSFHQYCHHHESHDLMLHILFISVILSDEAGERKLYETVEKLKVYQASKLSYFYTALLYTCTLNVPLRDS